MTANAPIRVGFAPPFSRIFKQLYKKYPSIRDDVQGLTERLQAGEQPGELVPGIDYAVYRVRVQNSDIRGESGRYRVIYYLQARDFIVLLTVYTQSEETDLLTEEIRRILEGYQRAR